MNTIWIIEDHVAFRRTLVRVLNTETGLQCTRDFDSCEKALAALAHDEAPGLILLDVGLPGMSGLDGIRLLKERAPKSLVVILTVFEDDDKVFQAVCAGAAGYLLDMFSKFAPKQSDYGLSDREKEILLLMTTGLIKKEIADKLTLSIHTVDTYLRRIYEKLEVNTRTGAVAKALKEGLV